MSESNTRLLFPRVPREHLIGNVALREAAAKLGARLPSGEANNYVLLAIDHRPGAGFDSEQLRAVSVMTPSELPSTAAVDITLSPELNGNSVVVADRLMAKMAQIATGNFAHLDVKTHQPSQNEAGEQVLIETKRTVDL